jgi:hypothetical protein
VGLDVLREDEDEHFEPVIVFDRAASRTRVVEPASDESSRRTFIRPAASLGFKGYLSRRAYFRADARIGVKRQIEDVIVRFGFGVDF